MRAQSNADLFRAVLLGQGGDDLPTLNLGAKGCYQHPWRGVVESGTDADGRPFAYCGECRDRWSAEAGQ
jgi:hypothetical protein